MVRLRRRYITFAAIFMKHLTLAQDFAAYTDPDREQSYDAPIQSLGTLMEVLTFGLFATFGGVALWKAYVTAQSTSMEDLRNYVSSVRARGASYFGETPRLEPRAQQSLSVEMTCEVAKIPNPMHWSKETDQASAVALPVGWKEVQTESGGTFFHNVGTGATTWERPA